jgi:hypothetical protein
MVLTGSHRSFGDILYAIWRVFNRRLWTWAEGFTVLLGSTAGPGGAAAAAGELLALFAPGLLALLLAQLAGSRRRRRQVLALLARAGRPATALATAGSFVAVVVVPVGHEPFSGRAQALASAGLVFYHADHLGSAVVVHTDTLSFQHAAYEPFGQSAGGAAVPEFGFTGQRFVAPPPPAPRRRSRR